MVCRLRPRGVKRLVRAGRIAVRSPREFLTEGCAATLFDVNIVQLVFGPRDGHNWVCELGWQEDVEERSRETRPTDDIDKIVVRQVHGAPIKKPPHTPSRLFRRQFGRPLLEWPKNCETNSAVRVAMALCSDGNAPKTTGALLKPTVYAVEWNRASMRARPPGEPFIE